MFVLSSVVLGPCDFNESVAISLEAREPSGPLSGTSPDPAIWFWRRWFHQTCLFKNWTRRFRVGLRGQSRYFVNQTGKNSHLVISPLAERLFNEFPKFGLSVGEYPQCIRPCRHTGIIQGDTL